MLCGVRNFNSNGTDTRDISSSAIGSHFANSCAGRERSGLLFGVGGCGGIIAKLWGDRISNANLKLPAHAPGGGGEWHLFCGTDDDHLGARQNRAGGVGLGLGNSDDLFYDRRRDVAAGVHAELATDHLPFLTDEVGYFGSRGGDLARVHARRDDVTRFDFDINRRGLFLRRGVDFGETGGVRGE